LQPSLLIFDDDRGQWGPMNDLRPVFEFRVGAQTVREMVESVFGRAAKTLVVPERMAAITAERAAGRLVNRLGDGSGPVLAVSGRWLGLAGAADLARLSLGEALVQARDGELVGALLTRADAQKAMESGDWRLPAAIHRIMDIDTVVKRPWDILRLLPVSIQSSLERSQVPLLTERPPGSGVMKHGGYKARVAASARVHPMVVFDCTLGDVVVEDDATIGSFTLLSGPCYIGRGSNIGPHATIRTSTAVGPTCVVSGEVAHSIIDSYSNKAHAGYLGNALVGQWVNLGADTNVSNLKNTYGSVRMQLEPGEEAQDTGQIKQGPVIGDFVRTGIGSRLTTGACIGTGAMLAVSGISPKYVERFAFLTDGAPDRFDAERFVKAINKAMVRRKQVMSPGVEKRVRELIDGK
jgi:UDP-N-acetylglucosamine diphosphorylase / glucose-1-phosphate thymidylyltransferase / UDP-N-acetylgalactosamine diphosphorylase / glucosamine-1-phosphate N-acetyltransferase / galactosamine-1-phosphate N-acetyltransferase